ncbi:hypothetical protein HII31_12047 [Pseudocercospora fuligena]|uniref:Ubiquitin-like domain-containing protein n=1 Tax=Pseudocercospora fuligena TaxID=685502 RepID=A0A8H6R8U8_9PEZI|nr:hypothetical protein HII31_12047 [Pseudocercospora fuligena]
MLERTCPASFLLQGSHRNTAYNTAAQTTFTSQIYGQKNSMAPTPSTSSDCSSSIASSDIIPLSSNTSSSRSSLSSEPSLFNDEAEQTAAQKFVIKVKPTSPDAQPIAMEARGSMTVTRLAQKVAAQEGSSVEEQLLEFEDQEIFNGRWKGIDLRRSRMLAPFGITDKSTIVQKDPDEAGAEES